VTLEEVQAREAIRHTLAAYNMGGDLRQADAVAAAFTEGGAFRSPIFDLKGRDQIRAWFGERVARSSSVRMVRHHITTSLIQLESANTASVRTYFTVFSDRGADHGGVYNDRFEQVGQDWLIALRDIQTDWTRADSVLVPAASRIGAVIVDCANSN
jgi:nuclear transport factor 2 (NTF2) superfamily protein